MTSITITFYSFPRVPAKWNKELHSMLHYAFLLPRLALFVWSCSLEFPPQLVLLSQTSASFSTKLTQSSLPLHWIPFPTTWRDLTRRIWLVGLLGHTAFLCLSIQLTNNHHHHHHHSDNNISYYFLVASYVSVTFACVLPGLSYPIYQL